MTTFLKITTLNSLFAFLLIWFLPAQWKVDIRFALFSRFTQNSQLFRLPIDEFPANSVRFVKFKNIYLDGVIKSNQIKPFAFEDSISLDKRIKKIILTYSKNGGSGCGNYSDDLIKNIKWLHEDDGHGCCSDHSQVFIAMCLVNNILAREVHHLSHTFDEYYDPNTHSWVWVDSQYCLMAADSNGKLLSFVDIFDHFQQNITPNWQFFGTKQHLMFGKQDISATCDYFTKHEFGSLVMILGNNVFEVDYYNKKFSWLVKDIRQGLFLFTGIQPSYLIYDPFNRRESYFKKVKFKFYESIVALFTANLFLFLPKGTIKRER